MKISAQLGAFADRLADDELTVRVDLEAPAAPEPGHETGRVGSCLQIVLDRGAAMDGAPLEGALDAIAAIAHRLDARDSFGLVAFDAEAAVLVPAGPLTDMDEVVDRLARIEAAGPSHLAAGYRRGLDEVRRATDESGATLLVVSDGHAGLQPHRRESLEQLARDAHADGIVTSTLTYGRGGDELLLPALARAGSGRHHRARSASAVGAAIASEVADLLARSVQSVTLAVRLEDDLEVVGVDPEVPSTRSAGGLTFELGDLYFDEQRQLALRLRVPALHRSGLRRLGSLDLCYAELPSLVEQRVVVPLILSTPSRDQAAGATTSAGYADRGAAPTSWPADGEY